MQIFLKQVFILGANFLIFTFLDNFNFQNTLFSKLMPIFDDLSQNTIIVFGMLILCQQLSNFVYLS